MGAVGRLGQKLGLSRICHSLWSLQGDRYRSMVLKRSVTAYGQDRETGTETWTWNCISGPMSGVMGAGKEAWSWQGLSRPMGGVGDLDRSTVLHLSITNYGRCR